MIVIKMTKESLGKGGKLVIFVALLKAQFKTGC